MHTVKHEFTNSNVCLYKKTNKVIIGSFFKEKPQVNTVIISLRNAYKVQEIVENRDAVISSDCQKDPSNAWFHLKVEQLNDNQIRDLQIQV